MLEFYEGNAEKDILLAEVEETKESVTKLQVVLRKFIITEGDDFSEDQIREGEE